jgi:hypothetical protein
MGAWTAGRREAAVRPDGRRADGTWLVEPVRPRRTCTAVASDVAHLLQSFFSR